MGAEIPGTDIWGRFIPLDEWGPLIDEYLSDPAKGPIFNVAPPEVDDREYDAIFIGGGAAGRFGSAFLRARGGRQLVIDKWPFLGGSCPHEACVPHHVFSEAAKELDYARQLSGKYWHDDWDNVKKRASILNIRDGFLAYRGAAHGIMNFQSKEQLGMEYILNAEAKVIDKNTVEAAGRVYRAKNLVLCVGARPTPPPIAGLDKKGVIDWMTILDPDVMNFEPNKCVVIGGGKTAIEYGSFIHATGCDTTLLTRSRLMKTAGLHHVDEGLRDYVQAAMERRGMVIVDTVEPVAVLGDERVTGVRYRNMQTGEESTVDCDLVFIGTGERPQSHPFADVLGLELDEKGHIKVDKTMQTSVPGVYACGDVTPGAREMFKARKGGVTAAKNIMGEHTEIDFSDYPDFLHSTYEIAWTGLSEEEAREQYENVVVIQIPPKGIDPRHSTLPISDGTMFYAMEGKGDNGFGKSVIDADSRRIVGLHFVSYGIKNAFQYLDYLLRQEGGFTVDQMATVTELFLNEGYPQLHRLRAGAATLTDL